MQSTINLLVRMCGRVNGNNLIDVATEIRSKIERKMFKGKKLFVLSKFNSFSYILYTFLHIAASYRQLAFNN